MTDMAKHHKHLKTLENFVAEQKADKRQDSQDAETHKDPSEKFFILGCTLHAADISNVAKEERIMLCWTEKLLDEYWRQGEDEKRLGLPISPLMDKDIELNSVPKSQL